MTGEDLAALSQAVRHNVGWLDVPAADDNALGAMRDRVGRGLFLELGRLPANSPNITFKITEEGRAAIVCASLAA
jgi:hypothetical protein